MQSITNFICWIKVKMRVFLQVKLKRKTFKNFLNFVLKKGPENFARVGFSSYIPTIILS